MELWCLIITIACGIITTISLLYAIRFRPKQKVTLELISSIVISPEMMKHGLKFMIEDKIYDKPIGVYYIKLCNRGNKDLAKDDIIEEIVIHTPVNTEIAAILAGVGSSDRFFLKLEDDDRTKMMVHIDLLKPKEFITLSLFVVSQSEEMPPEVPEFRVKSAIKNFPEIKYYPYVIQSQSQEKSETGYRYFIVGTGLAAVTIFILSLFVESLKSVFGDFDNLTSRVMIFVYWLATLFTVRLGEWIYVFFLKNKRHIE